MKAVKFDKNHSKDFVTDLRKDVEEYFKKNNISRYGNFNMAIKTIVMLGLFFGSHTIILSGIVENSWLFWSLWL